MRDWYGGFCIYVGFGPYGRRTLSEYRALKMVSKHIATRMLRACILFAPKSGEMKGR